MSYPTFPAYPILPPRKKEEARGRKEAAAAAMRRSASRERDGGDAGVAAVAVDGDRSSQHALKWAADHVLSRAHPFFLLHVRRKHTSLHTAGGKQFSISHVQDDVAASFLAQMDLQTKELLIPFQCFCSRRGLQCREIILDGTDVSKAIVDFVVHQNVDKVVLGVSSRNAFTRTIWKLDVPTSVTRSAPNFCSVYVIAKGKLSSFKPATHANANGTIKEDLKSDAHGNQILAIKSEPACKLPVEGACSSRPMLVHAARPVDAISDESTEEGSLRSPDQQAIANCSHVKTSSCPSEFSGNLDQQGNYLSPEYPGYHFLPNKDDECDCHAPHRKYLGFDEPSFNESPLSPGYKACVHLSPTPCGECTPPAFNYETEDVVAELRHFNLEMKQKNGDMLPWNYKELPFDAEGRTEDSYAISEEENEPLQDLSEKKRAVETNLPYKDRPDAEPSSSILGPKHKRLTLDTSSSDIQCRGSITEEFRDHNSQEVVNPILRRLPPKFYSPRNDGKHGSASEQKYELDLKCKSLPRPIETKRMLECLPTRLQCRIYKPEEIANATDHFSTELKVGEGGYGPVYRATLDNTLVAVKVLHSNITQGLEQFQQELELLNNIRHPNMVHLVGACPEYGCLVYEYMPNGSLEDRLFCRSGTPPMSWQLRFKIAVEIATGLLYLHKMKPEAFVHRDLKPGNILLDKDFVSKIGDVGLACIIPRSMDDTVTQYRMTDAAGTFCYIDPEYQKTGLVSTKSDVYALGIIYLQMITAKDAMGLAYGVSDALEEGTFEELLDPNVTGWPVEVAQKFAELALKCCELRRRDRPDLESIVLPELIRLHALTVSSEDSSTDQGHQRSASDKDLPLDNDLAEILSDGIVKGASFAG